ncbi:MAG: sensor histidine kinase [Saprospiraceae bacterium]
MINYLISQFFLFLGIFNRLALCWILSVCSARAQGTPDQAKQFNLNPDPVSISKNHRAHWSEVYTGLVILIGLGSAYYLRKIQGEIKATRVRAHQLQQERDQLAERLEALQYLNKGRIRSFQHISHDLRSPLSFIIGPTGDLLCAPNVTESQRAQLQRILRNAKKINHLIDDILEVSQFAANGTPLKIQPVEAASCLLAICEDYKIEAEKNKIAFHLEYRLPASLVVHTDPGKLERILDNLLQNALKFTPEGGNITLEMDATPDAALILTVRDTGIGIAPEYLGLIFEQYFRAPTGKQTRGLGIGLAASRAYARALGGEIIASSIPHQGTTFQVQIPCMKTNKR